MQDLKEILEIHFEHALVIGMSSFSYNARI